MPFNEKPYYVLASCLLLAACDPGYWMEPEGLACDRYARPTLDAGDLQVRPSGFGGLVGEWWLSASYQISSDVGKVRLDSAVLRPERGRFSSDGASPPDSVLESDVVTARWTFARDTTAASILGPHAAITLFLTVNRADRREATIRYQRIEPGGVSGCAPG